MKGENMEEKYSVFKEMSYRPRYYLRHPIRWIGDKCREIRWGWQRATRGYADCDAWNFDIWFSHVVPSLLDHLADNSNGWPDSKFETHRDWVNWIHKLAATIRFMREDQQDEVNECWPAYQESLDNWQAGGYDTRHEEMFHQYYKRARELAAKADEDFAAIMPEFVKYFHCLWD